MFIISCGKSEFQTSHASRHADRQLAGPVALCDLSVSLTLSLSLCACLPFCLPFCVLCFLFRVSPRSSSRPLLPLSSVPPCFLPLRLCLDVLLRSLCSMWKIMTVMKMMLFLTQSIRHGKFFPYDEAEMMILLL